MDITKLACSRNVQMFYMESKGYSEIYFRAKLLIDSLDLCNRPIVVFPAVVCFPNFPNSLRAFLALIALLTLLYNRPIAILLLSILFPKELEHIRLSHTLFMKDLEERIQNWKLQGIVGDIFTKLSSSYHVRLQNSKYLYLSVKIL